MLNNLAFLDQETGYQFALVTDTYDSLFLMLREFLDVIKSMPEWQV